VSRRRWTAESLGAWTLASGLPSVVPETRATPLTLGDRLALCVGLVSVAAWRLVQIRDLELPSWVDAVHHTLLVRVLLEQGRIPETWGPYLPDVPLYYHFGFHLSAAVVAWLTGWEGLRLGRAVLATGLLWQLVLASGVYALALRLSKSAARALTALLLVGFVSQMPAHYVTWSRYTLLAGVALLVWGMTAALAARPVLVAVLLSACAITHYYAFVLLLAFLACAIACRAGGSRLRLAAAAAAGLLMSAPWLVHVWSWTRAFARAPRTTGAAASPRPDQQLWSLLGPDRNHLLLLLAALGVWILAGRLWRGACEDPGSSRALLVWTLLCLALLRWHLGPFRPDHAAIVLFLPAVLLAAEALWTVLPRVSIPLVVASLVAWGAAETRSIVDPETVLARRDDVAALAWIEAATPPDATFLVDTRPWMGIWRGTDGGWWITPLTGRRTVLPSLAYSFGQPERTQRITATAKQVHALASLPGSEYCAALQRLMRQTRADYYYTHAGRARGCGVLVSAYQAPGGPGIYTLAPAR
jgi:hypothetical protein